jgi:hypothetical protein
MENAFWEAQIESFRNLRPPFRPHPSEIQFLEEVASNLAKSPHISNLQVLILGLTCEIVHLRWPEGTSITVVERSPLMIEHFWPGDIPGQRKIMTEDWLSMSLQPSSFDMIVGDGVFNFMSYPDGYQNFAHVLSRLIQKNGLICIRIFNQISPKENPADLLSDFREASNIDYFPFRLRLATSLQDNAEKGICMSKEILDQYLIDQGIPLKEFYAKSKYTPPSYPSVPLAVKPENNRITYPTDEEFTNQIGHYFSVQKVLFGAHQLALRTPVFVLSPL